MKTIKIKPYFRAIFFCIILLSIIFVGCESDFNKKNKKNLVTEDSDSIKKIDTVTEIVKIKPPKLEHFSVIIGTFLGNKTRNYYGDSLPEKLDVIWTFDLGTGKTRVGKDIKLWSGAGWTGQPLLIREDSNLYIIQGAYDYGLNKINAKTGEKIWEYFFDDVIKGTGTVWVNPDTAASKENQIVILQGSRQGFDNSINDKIIKSYRGISFETGQALWYYNSKRTSSYSRDVDGSALILNDTAYLGLENGFFITFNPNPKKAILIDAILQPEVLGMDSLFEKKDIALHGGNLVTESSCSYLKNKIYISSGSGHIYAYNLKTKKIDWDFYTGSDIDGSPVVTNDNCIIVALEKQYITGNGGVIKLDPSKKPEDAVVWYFPTANKEFALWHGGVIGSVGVNDFYITNPKDICIAAFTGIDEQFYVVNHKEIDTTKMVLGFDNVKKYYTPKLVYQEKNGPSISTPIIVQNRILCATYSGLFLYEFDKKMNFKKLDSKLIGSVESTPITYNGRIYVASRSGLFYCFGSLNKKEINYE